MQSLFNVSVLARVEYVKCTHHSCSGSSELTVFLAFPLCLLLCLICSHCCPGVPIGVGKSLATLHYVDYGNTEQVKHSGIYKLPQAFSSLPCQVGGLTQACVPGSLLH